MRTAIQQLATAWKVRRDLRDMGYRHLPCFRCVWAERPEKEDEYMWVWCDHCDWGNK